LTARTHPDVPPPAGVEFCDPDWHQSPNVAGHYRRFATKKFPVFDRLTVHTGGIQFAQADGEVFVMRDVRVVGSAISLTDVQAHKFAQALIDAGDYIGELTRLATPSPCGGPIRAHSPPAGETIRLIHARDATQAEVLIGALCDMREKMTDRMTWLEKHGSGLDAAALRRDINEAQAHITRLQGRFLGETAAPQRAQQAR
jgi:hypothetical protein